MSSRATTRPEDTTGSGLGATPRTLMVVVLLARLTVAVLGVGLLGGCAGGSTAAPDAASVVRRLGAVPIPPTSPAQPIAQASPGHPQVLAIGEPIALTTPATAATVTLLGPDLAVAPGATHPPDHADAIFTVHASASAGELVLAASEFTGRDDHGRELALTPLGPPAVTASSTTATATLRLSAHVKPGAAQLTWRHHGAVIALWTFTTELD